MVRLDSPVKPGISILRSAERLAGSALEFEVRGEAMDVHAELFDLSGRLVRDFGWAEYTPGKHTLAWGGTDSAGRRLAAGIQFLRLSTPSGLSATAKILTLKGGK
jgi:hypothetical protein